MINRSEKPMLSMGVWQKKVLLSIQDGEKSTKADFFQANFIPLLARTVVLMRELFRCHKYLKFNSLFVCNKKMV